MEGVPSTPATAIRTVVVVALQLGPASRVAPIDKLSLPITIVLAAGTLGEPLTLKLAGGVALMTIGALLTLS